MPPSGPRYAEIVVTLPVEGRFHYEIPEHLQSSLEIGHRVSVPFGKRRVTGFVLGFSDEAPDGYTGKIRKITEVLDDAPLLTEDLLALVAFAADYYLAPAGEVLRVALPPGLTAASVSTLEVTPGGKRALESGRLEAKERELLERASQRRVKTGDVAKTLRDRLLERGWLGVRIAFDAKESQETLEVLERDPRAPEDTLDKLRRAPARRRLYEALGDKPRAIDELASELGRDAVRRAMKGLMTEGLVVRRRVPKDEWYGQLVDQDLERALHLSEDQNRALERILSAMKAETHAAYLLRGVTGSGKTEVYLQAIAEARQRGKSAIVLVPEIALTSQLEARFRARFGSDVAVLHSGMSDRQRRTSWHRLRHGICHIALGPRSAVWAPVQDLGIIVVDEEHDASFKQNTELRYNGRDLALFRAHKTKCVSVLGSATPSLETRQLAKSGRLTELRLGERIAGRPMPEVSIVDLGSEKRRGQELPLFSRPLEDALREVVGKKEQAILFLNRRGFNTVVVCDACGEIRKCPECSVSLTHHKSEGGLFCHYCGHREPFAKPCEACSEIGMKPYGFGTERIAEELRTLVPDARVLRLDRDITAKTGALEETLTQFREGEADVLVGTQMVAKGHDFPRVTLVGILCADTSLAFPDFRAAERTFQLLTQVAGRAGRADLPGRVIVQTFQPGHYALECAIEHDDDRFFDIESEMRRAADYPPFARIGLIRIESEKSDLARRVAEQVGELARATCRGEGLRARGPVSAPIERVRGRWRHMVMVSAPTPARLAHVMGTVRERLGKTPASVDVIFDVDALDML